VVDVSTPIYEKYGVKVNGVRMIIFPIDEMENRITMFETTNQLKNEMKH
jgi:hypothetical protein